MAIPIRLLYADDSGEFQYKTFTKNETPPYAILSHTWSLDTSDEVTFSDIIARTHTRKPGYKKLEFCHTTCTKGYLRYFWIDSCCIDKANEYELHASISLMYQWYENATKCYVYMADVSVTTEDGGQILSASGYHQAFLNSRWFTRGWTLQELLAPRTVMFYSCEGSLIGSKQTLREWIREATGIPFTALEGQDLRTFSVEERFSWAKNRHTKHGEDMAYCLFGLFGVSIDIRYGEGKESSMTRLRTQIGGAISGSSVADNVLDWLSTLDFSVQQADIISTRYPGTGNWLISSKKFIDWKMGPGGTLICPGIPGAGKTMAAAIVIDHFIKQTVVDLAWVFCNYKQQASQTASALLASILMQILRQWLIVEGIDGCIPCASLRSAAEADVLRRISPPLREVLHTLDEHMNSGDRPSCDELVQALVTLGSRCGSMYIVVDALDECSDQYAERSRLIKGLRYLQRATSNSRVHLMFTTRMITEIIDTVGPAISLEVRATKADIRLYTERRLIDFPVSVRSDLWLKHSISERIVKVSEGMFILARLHLDKLQAMADNTAIALALLTLKSGLEALDISFREALERIDAQLAVNRQLSRNALSWILYSRRQLDAHELCHALSINSDHTHSLYDILGACSGLLVHDERGNTVRLVHYSAQEFFDRTADEWLPDAQQYLAETCLSILQHGPRGWCYRFGEFTKRCSEFVMFLYCADHIQAHIQLVEQQVCDSVLRLLDDRARTHAIFQAIFLRPLDEELPVIEDGALVMDKVPPKFPDFDVESDRRLHVAAALNLPSVAMALLRTGVSVDDRDLLGQTPLAYASRYGNAQVAEVLLDKSYNKIDSATGRVILKGQTFTMKEYYRTGEIGRTYGCTPLHQAALKGHERIVTLLLKLTDADINAKVYSLDQTPLILAVENDHGRLAQLLLTHPDIDVAVGDYDRKSALHYAVEKGQTEVVALLLQFKAIDDYLRSSYGIKVLLSNASPWRPYRTNLTRVAKRRKDWAILSMLNTHKAQYQQEMRELRMLKKAA